jgi:hypothetical protein
MAMVGRPSKYEERFCDELEQFMAQGYSATAFAGHIGVSRATIDNWAKEHQEFMEALHRAKAKRLLEWEKIGLKVAREGGTGGQSTMITFGLKNMGGGEWFDKQQLEHSGKGGGPIQTASEMTPLEAARLIAFAWAKAERELEGK